MNISLTVPAITLGLLIAAAPAIASDYDVLIKAKKYAEAEKLADARLAQDSASADAMIGKIDAILASGNDTRFEEAIKLAQQCVARVPAHAGCQVALGKAMGIKAMNGGMMAAASSAGKIRDAFKKAVELDPRNLEARFSLLQFYMMAPGFMGGGVDRAQSLLAQTAAMHPEAGKLMTAMIDAADERLAKAEAAASASQPGADQELKERLESLYLTLGAAHIGEKRFVDAERVLREGARRFPDSEQLPFAVARATQEQGRHREALALMETVLAKAPRASVHYRMAQSLQALGDKARAIAAYEKALAIKPALNKKFRSDAEDQLKSLKG